MKKTSISLPQKVIFSILALYSCVLIPLYQFLITDVVLMNTIWLDIVDLLCQHMETLGSVAIMVFVIFGIYQDGKWNSKRVLLTAVLALAFKYAAAIASISIELGSLDLTGGLSSYLVAFFLELTIAAFVLFLTVRLVLPIQKDLEAKKTAAQKLNRELKQAPLYPFQRIFSWKNPIQRVLFISILNVTLWRLAAAIISEFAYGVLLRPGDVPVILFYWFLLILLPSFYSYFLALLLLKRWHKHAEKELADEEDEENCEDDDSNEKNNTDADTDAEETTENTDKKEDRE